MPVVERWGLRDNRWCWLILRGASGENIMSVYADALSGDQIACERVANRSRGEGLITLVHAAAFLKSLLVDRSPGVENGSGMVGSVRLAPSCSAAHARSEGVLAKKQRYDAPPSKLLTLPREQLQFVMTGQKTLGVRIYERGIGKLIAGDRVSFKSGSTQYRAAHSIDSLWYL